MFTTMTRTNILLLASCIAALPAGEVVAAGDIEAITKPSKDVTLSFVRPGQIAGVLVKDGQYVKPGQILVQLDDLAEQAQLAQLKAEAEDTTHIKAAKAKLDQMDLDYKKIKKAKESDAATEMAVEHARLDVTIAQLSHELSRFQHKQNKRKHKEFELRVGRMRLKSPIAGRVERVFVEKGESVDSLQEVVRIVNIDPLWIDVPVPLQQARRLKSGRIAQVAFDKAGKEKVDGKIVHIASVADAASDTLNVRVELPNRSNRPAGEKVYVRFPPSDNNKTDKVKTISGRPDNIRPEKKGTIDDKTK
ncbi:MAG: efflux RND transporter periplasmic adaptor subunit [Phycisphaerae bacterium]|nr:efflux RND transporter periplasmic adaptor subunit [Phycisphaerae bacterium]